MINERMRQLAGITEAGNTFAFKAYEELKESNFPVKVPEAPKKLGDGTQGVVFDIGKGKVLKITKDESEAKASSLVAKKGLRGIWKIDAVYETERFFPKLWFIVGERLKEDRMRALDAVVITDTFHVDSKQWDKPYFNEVIREITYPHDQSAYEVRKAKDKARLDAIELAHAMRNLNELGISYKDMHAGNVMFRGSKPVVVDLGHSRSAWGNTEVFESAFK